RVEEAPPVSPRPRLVDDCLQRGVADGERRTALVRGRLRQRVRQAVAREIARRGGDPLEHRRAGQKWEERRCPPHDLAEVKGEPGQRDAGGIVGDLEAKALPATV